MIIPERIKCTILYEGNEFDVTRSVTEWDSLETVFKRDGTSGVLSTVTFPISLITSGRDLVKRLFDARGLYAKAWFNVYERGDFDNNYTLLKSILMDFSTYKEYDNKVTIECAEEELTELINSEGKTKYDIPVSEVVDSKRWEYQRTVLMNSGKFVLAENQEANAVAGDLLAVINSVQLSMSMPDTPDIIPGSPEVDMKEQELQINNPKDYFMKSMEKTVNCFFNVNFTIECEPAIKESDLESAQKILTDDFLKIVIGTRNNSGNGTNANSVILYPITEVSRVEGESARYYKRKYSGSISWDSSIPHSLRKDEHFVFQFETGKVDVAFLYFKCTITKFNSFQISWYEQSSDILHIDVINPVTLLHKYLDRMSSNPGYFTCDIQWKETDYQTMIVAAESIRGFQEANLHGSPNDFFEWMKVLGYEYEVKGKKLVFKPRDEFFKRDMKAIELEERDVADLIIQADSTHAYTSVEIGYDKQEYDSENGRCEANGTFCYTTGFVTRDDNKLSLISPYRADSIGIELLCQERDNSTTDTKSDNDIFFVALSETSGKYVEYTAIRITDTKSEVKIFNAPFNPYFLVQRNLSLIGINTSKLKFKSTDMSRDAGITGVDNIYKDFTITEKIFDPIEYNFAAGHHHDLPEESVRNGLVYFEWQGSLLKGFIKEIRKNYATESETTWILHCVK